MAIFDAMGEIRRPVTDCPPGRVIISRWLWQAPKEAAIVVLFPMSCEYKSAMPTTTWVYHEAFERRRGMWFSLGTEHGNAPMLESALSPFEAAACQRPSSTPIHGSLSTRRSLLYLLCSCVPTQLARICRHRHQGVRSPSVASPMLLDVQRQMRHNIQMIFISEQRRFRVPSDVAWLHDTSSADQHLGEGEHSASQAFVCIA